MRFGKLTVIEIDHFQQSQHSKRTFWKCRCDCGKITIVRSDSLTSGKTKSCGCYNTTCRIKPESIKKHKLYRVYWAMKSRCYKKSDKHFNRYGGRGIHICNEWLNSYECFYEWAMKNGYQEGLSIDRIDNDGNYEPSNCRWITIQEQQKNKTQRKTKSYYSK